MTHRITQRGFTLIEALVYLSLFAILMGGAVVAAYNLFEAAERGATHVMLQEETDFLLAKVAWTLSGASGVTAPAAGATGSALTVAKWDTSLGSPFVLARSGNNLTLTRGTGAAALLNNTNVEVRSIAFKHIEGAGDGINPDSVETVITTAARTPNGFLLTKTATTTSYLRR